MSTTACLDADALAALLESESPEAMAEYADHLETCAHCQQTVAELSEKRWKEQDVVYCLQPALDRACGSEPALTRVMAQLKSEFTLLHNTDDETGLETEDALAILTPSERPELLGTLGGYEVQEIIGRGGMGVVYKALDPALNRPVAIKVMAAAAGGPVARRRFMREAQAAAAVSHDHIVTVHGVHEASGLPYLVMQYIAGESLQDRLDREGPLAELEIVRIGQQTAAGLAAAHAQGLIHRDIKPANLLLEEGQDRVRITDFGLARTPQDAGLTQAGVVAGTPEYMAPEQAQGEPVDHRADLFSLGCVLYAMCTGKPPFRAATPLAVLRQITDETPAPVRSLNPQVPVWLASLAELLLAKNPAQRVQTAGEVAKLLEGYLAHLRDPVMTPAPELPVEEALQRGQRGARKPPRWLFGLVACLGVGLTLLGLYESGYLLPGSGLAIEQNSRTGVLNFNLRGQAPDGQLLDYVGPNAYEYCKAEAGGLRISLPPNREHPWPVGVRLAFPVKGDCEISVSYELLKADKPASGYGIGATLYVIADGPGKKAAMVGNLNRPEGSGYICDFNVTNDLGKRKFDRKSFSSEVQSGKLRLVRVGSWVSYQVAEPGASEFRELQKIDFGTEPLIEVRAACDTGNSTSPGEVRIADFHIRGANLPTVGPGGRGWWLLTALGIVVLIAALGVWFYVRRNVHTMSSGHDDSQSPQSPTRNGAKKIADFIVPALLLCIAAGLALSWLTADGDGETKTTPSSAPSPAQGLFQDFRDQRPLIPGLVLVGKDVEEYTKAEPQGYRLALPAGRKAPRPLIGIGVKNTFDLEGNFQITGSYELLASDKPTKPKDVVGMELFIMRGPDGKRLGRIGRFNTKEGLVYEVHDQDYTGTRKREPAFILRTPTEEKQGQLRLERSGTVLSYLVKDATTGGGFKELHKTEFGSEPLSVLLYGVTPGDDFLAVDGRLVDLRVDSGGDAPGKADSKPVSEQLPRTGGRTRLALLFALGLALVLLLGAGVALWRARRKDARSAAGVGDQPVPEPVNPPLAFACSGCGKRLKARADLAGKKVKCPQCGQAVAVPAAAPEGAIRPAL